MALSFDFPSKEFNFKYHRGKEIKEQLLSGELTFLAAADENTTANDSMIKSFALFLDHIQSIDSMIQSEAEKALLGKEHRFGYTVEAYFNEYCLIYGINRGTEILSKFSLCHAVALYDEEKQILFADYEIKGGEEAGFLVFYFNEDLKIENIEIEY